jgi:hypothetical protein
MTHTPNIFDVVTDLRRCLLATYSNDVFEDENAKLFLKKAEINLNLFQERIGSETYLEIKKRIKKAKDNQNLLHKRREDLLTASCLLY